MYQSVEQALSVATHQHATGQLFGARAIYQWILTRKPDHADALHQLGVLIAQSGDVDRGIALIRQAILKDPSEPVFHSNLGMMLEDLGRIEEALASYRQAVSLNPQEADPRYKLGNALRAMGNMPDAITCYQEAVRLNPSHAGALNNLGISLKLAGRIPEAINCLEASRSQNPADYGTLVNLASALAGVERYEEAITHFQSALALKPEEPAVYCSLAAALIALCRFDEAAAICRRALEINPNFADAHIHLAAALRETDQLDEAIRCWREVIRLRAAGQLIESPQPMTREWSPDARAHNALGTLLKDTAQISAALDELRLAVFLAPDGPQFRSNLIFAMLYDPHANAAAISAEMAEWNQRHAEPLAPLIAPHFNNATPERRLKIGYVSPDFYGQAESCFVRPLFEAHNRELFEIHAYASVAKPDAVTAQLQRCVDRWHDVRALSNEQLATKIRADGIDILVDLTMHMGRNRLELFARKPAPVQATWLAYPGSTGVRAIDYRLTDAWMDPPGLNDSHYSEKSIRLPNSWCCYHPLSEIPPVNALPALHAGHITFGSLNNACKNNAMVFVLWAEVLARTPGSRLMLLSPQGNHRKEILAFFNTHQIADERIEFVSSLPRLEYLRQYHRIDIALDPFPYNGITTTCDALLMGVPVISSPGTMAPSRAGLSLLQTAGLSECVAENPAHFVDVAVNLALDVPRLANLRATLRQRMESSPLMDAQAFARNIEQAYRTMWREWAAQRPSF